ncbi:CD48 antigen isoform X2 [Ochotona princeps]|uniref:CD48 antigen isoform X2 n=1 Tax=Ochotona princeps TaxID=9978 RepID=UPI002714854F|nr:CD48 antigen isoform X2 [Ochotona princeps]
MCSSRWEWCLALELLLLPSVLLETNTQDLYVTAVSGSNVSLCVSNLPSIYRQLTWFNTTKQKLLECESGKIKYFDTKSRNRITFDPQSSALNISDVQKEDSNTYLVRILKEGGNEHEWRIHLSVLDPVPNPVINIEKKEEMDNCFLTLTCTAQNQSAVKYTWYDDSRLLNQEFQGNVLKMTVNSQNYSSSYTCQVKNSVSGKNQTVYFSKLCELASSFAVAQMASWLVVLAPIVNVLLLT